MPSFLRSLFSRKTARRLAVTVAAVILLIFAVRAFENWRGARAWSAYRAEAARRGVPLDLAAFLPPEVPSAENYAAIPIIQEFFTASDNRQLPPAPFAPRAMRKTQDPPVANRFSGVRFDAVKWRDAILDMRLLEKPTDNPARDILTGLGAFDPVLKQFHEAAARPHSRFPVHWEKGILAMYPHYSFLQSAGHYETLRMNAHLLLGESAAAYTAWRDGLAICRALEREPTTMCGLVRLAILARLETAVWDGLAGHHWAEPELRSLSADFAALNLLADLRFTVSSERASINAAMDWAGSLSLRDRALFFNGPASLSSTRANTSATLLCWLYPAGWFRLSQVKMNEVFDHSLAPLDVEQGVFAGTPSTNREMTQSLNGKGLLGRIPYLPASIMMPPLDGLVTTYLAQHTVVQQARLACTLELFRRAHHTYPERLEELIPDLLDAVPRDVTDGAPMRYRHAGEHYVLWSIALNHHDDGGQTGPTTKLSEQLDWIWHD